MAGGLRNRSAQMKNDSALQKLKLDFSQRNEGGANSRENPEALIEIASPGKGESAYKVVW